MAFITALFATRGWMPNAAPATLISPMLVMLLPILIGFSGGRLVYGIRGGVVGAVATMGAIAASDAPMFLGAMALGPLGGWAIRQWDRAVAGRCPAALQMLVANFSAGLLAALLALGALVVVAPVVRAATVALAAAAERLMASGLLPLVAVVIEPAIAGGVAANAVFVATGAGLVATPSPGSIFAELAMAPRGGARPVVLGILTGALVTFLAAAALVRRVGAGDTTTDLADAQARTRSLKHAAIAHGRSIVFACDAGMGSSVLGSAVLRRKLKDAGIDVAVTHVAIGELPASADLVVVHASLEDRVRRQAPDAVVFAIDDFVRSTAYDRLVEVLRNEVRA